MLLGAKIFAGLAAVMHVMFFVFESVLFTRPDVYSRFQMTAEQAELVRVWALNQGFYNLFLAVGCFVGIGLAPSKPRIGWTLIVNVTGMDEIKSPRSVLSEIVPSRLRSVSTNSNR